MFVVQDCTNPRFPSVSRGMGVPPGLARLGVNITRSIEVSWRSEWRSMRIRLGGVALDRMFRLDRKFRI